MAALVWLAACGTSEPVNPTTGANLAVFARCQAALREQHAVFDVLAPVHTKEGCGYDEGLSVSAAPVPFSKPAVLACPLALTFTRFMDEVVQPAARRHFGQRVVRVNQISSYQCRRVDGTGRLSLHAHGEAIDVSGFDLADGRRIVVARDWRGHGEATLFLREVAEGACKVFQAALTPNYDRSHANHMHFDVGPRKLCGI